MFVAWGFRDAGGPFSIGSEVASVQSQRYIIGYLDSEMY